MNIIDKIDGFIMEQKKEDSDEYKEFFKKKMKEWKISSPDELDNSKKKKFFDEVDKEWKGEEENEEEE